MEFAPVTGACDRDVPNGGLVSESLAPGPSDLTGVTDVWRTPSRRLLARHIVGSGVELGPGHVPFPGGPGTTVRFIDRWEPQENHELFPDLPDAEFPRPDIVADLNTDRLLALGDSSQDFVVCSHVLEHMAEPIGLLHEIHRVLRPGGVVLLLLPDRHRTFDYNRDPTSLAHLVAEYEAGVTEIDDDHVIEFIEKTGDSLGGTPAERQAILELHRRRSIHVHCWNDEEFFPVLLYGVKHLGWRWEFVDGTLSGDDEGPTSIEFGFVLRRGDTELTSAVVGQRLDTNWHVWRQARLTNAFDDARRTRLELQSELDRREDRMVELEAEVVARQVRLDRIDRSTPMRAYRIAKRILRWPRIGR